MLLSGTYTLVDSVGAHTTRSVFIKMSKRTVARLELRDSAGAVCAAYHSSGSDTKLYGSGDAESVVKLIHLVLSKLKAKSAAQITYDGKICSEHSVHFKKAGAEAIVITGNLSQSSIYRFDYQSPDTILRLSGVAKDSFAFSELEWITVNSNKTDSDSGVQVRSVDEIRLRKGGADWLKTKDYRIINDEVEAERIFQKLERFDGVIAYDTETTGLRINCFGKINSEYASNLREANEKAVAAGDAPALVDNLVGVIFCIEPNVSYYFPCGNRKFKNLYEGDSVVKQKLVDNIRVRYAMGNLCNADTDMARLIRSGADLSCDVILMERLRSILETKQILAHNGSFEYKVGLLYDIDTNLVHDTMLLHRLMYAFSSGKFMQSNLKKLTHDELGIDTWELGDFFPKYKEVTGGVRGKSSVDFSYMDYAGALIYAPADGDTTLQLYRKYIKDLNSRWKDLQFLYQVEVNCACAIGYSEFYGHRLDEESIVRLRNEYDYVAADNLAKLREAAGLSSEHERELHALFVKETDKAAKAQLREQLETEISVGIQLNPNSPVQMAKLFYDTLGVPEGVGGRSCNKDAVKEILLYTNEDGSVKYPAVKYYSDYVKAFTLIKMFFNKLPEFMYPGGFIFSSFGQISTATGRMSCIAEGELVTLVGERKPIENVKVGDLVYCYDDDKNLHIRPVEAVMDNGERECVEVKWKARSGRVGSVVCTADHRIRLTDGSWVHAGDLTKGEKLAHLFVGSSNGRPFLNGWSGFRDAEHKFVGREWLGCESNANGVGSCVHHINGDSTDNHVTNLQVLTHAEHSRLHTLEKHATGVLTGKTLTDYAVAHPLRGAEHANFKAMSKAELEQMLRDAGGYKSKVPMDFDTFKKKCREQGVDVNKIWRETTTGITDEQFIAVYNECEGGVVAMEYKLKLDRYRIRWRIKKLGLCYNHRVVSVTPAGKRRVYDLSVQDYPNFIASEINVHNCKKPNCQQYPKPITKIVVPRENAIMLDADYSQIEYRVIVALSKEKALADYFNDPDSDYHTLMASRMNRVPYASVSPEMRRIAKGFNFGIPFSIGMSRLAKMLYGANTPETRKKATEMRVEYFRDQPLVEQFFEDVKKAAENIGYTSTHFGRRRYYRFDSLDKAKAERAKASALRQAGNAVIQGCLRFDSKILTKEHGYVEIGELDGQSITVWDGNCWSAACVLPSGDKEEYKLKLSNGSCVFCSSEHKFLVCVDEFRERWATAPELGVGMHLRVAADSNDWRVKLTEAAVTSVENTGNIVPMFDVVNSETGRFMANGIVTHNSAADIFKTSLARVFRWIRKNGLFGKVFITNMVHDEQLFELDVTKVNVLKAVTDIAGRMQFKLDNFPPLFVGAGVGASWGVAKDKDAEMHPDLMVKLTEESAGLAVGTPDTSKSPKDWLVYFADRVSGYRDKKFLSYLTDPAHQGEALHPEIANLLRLQYGKLAGCSSAGSDAENTLKCVAYVIEKFGLEGLSADMFEAAEALQDEEDDVDFSDDDGDGYDELLADLDYGGFALIEDEGVAGLKLADIVKEFGFVVSLAQAVCAFNRDTLSNNTLECVLDHLLETYQCDAGDDGALELKYYTSGLLQPTGVYVHNVTTHLVEGLVVGMLRNDCF
jgi:DNA polymerase I-like protein with 3'-5' exonuclease and polymerase domains